jgi:hypothetical protein
MNYNRTNLRADPAQIRETIRIIGDGSCIFLTIGGKTYGRFGRPEPPEKGKIIADRPGR